MTDSPRPPWQPSAILPEDLFPSTQDIPPAEPPPAPPSLPEPIPQRPPVGTAALTAVLPVYNQADLLASSVEAWLSALDGLNREYELLLIDDGSTDATPSLLEEIARRSPRLRSFRHTAHRGLGACLRTALHYSREPLFFYTSSIAAYQPADLDRLFKWIDRVDLVVGYRTLASGGYRRRFRERLFALALRVLFAVRLKDPGCVFVLCRKTAFEHLPIQSNGSFAHAEIIAKANFLGCLMGEVPVQYASKGNSEAPEDLDPIDQPFAEMYHLFRQPRFGTTDVVAPGTPSTVKEPGTAEPEQ